MGYNGGMATPIKLSAKALRNVIADNLKLLERELRNQGLRDEGVIEAYLKDPQKVSGGTAREAAIRERLARLERRLERAEQDGAA